MTSVRKAIVSAMVFAVMASACAPGANARNESVQALEQELASLQGEVAALRTGQEALQSRLDQVAGQTGGNPSAITMAHIAVAQYILDTAGFHGMAEALAETGQVDPAYLSSLNRVEKVVSATTWPASLAGPVGVLQTELAAFRAALEADDGVGAAQAAELTHEAQHDLSHAIDEYLEAGGNEG